MAGLNKVMLIGNIGKDPEVFTFDSGTKKVSFSVATTESYLDKNTNEWVDQTDWHNVAGYRYLAEKNFAKGDLVYVEGKIKNRKYQDKDGNDKYFTEILADKINIIKKAGGNSQGYQSSNNEPQATKQEPTPLDNTDLPAGDGGGDDLPF
ncbi:MAG: single-stranded DNA-binding protein [Bacteroidetes bacterium]|nr:MAG: single-stranded DNA-binding protein [Bacteroidota bacterium]